MARFMAFRVFAFVLILAVLSPGARAGLIAAGDTTFVGQAIQDVTIYGNTGFNPGPEFTLYGLSGNGFFTIHREAQSGNSIAFTGGESFYSGFYPGLGNYTFGTGGAVGVGGFHGTIDNVTQNPNDPGYASGDPSSFAGGDYTAHITSFFFRLADGTLLETGGDYVLRGFLDGLPPHGFTVLQGSTTEQNPIYFGDPSNGFVIGFTTNGSIQVTGVPEPSSLVLLATGTAVLSLRLKRRMWKSPCCR